MRRVFDRAQSLAGRPPRREVLLVCAAMLIAVALVAIYVEATRSQGLGGDEIEYDAQATLFADGKLFWGLAPFGEPHATAWKAPGYPAWVGTLYAALGDEPFRVQLVQSLLAALMVGLTWLLARRLFNPTVAVASAFVVALFPLAWEFFGLLFPEALATPLILLALLVILGKEPTTGRAALAGAVIGLNLLVRPTSFFLLATAAVAWIVLVGWRRGAVLTVVTAGVAVLVVAPWTIRNAVVLDAFIPISIQDAAAYGTFNDEAANDDDSPWAWRPLPAGAEELTDPPEPLSEPEFRSLGQELARDYIADHPASVPKAFFWNGIVRFWDLRPPGDALDEVAFQGRSRTVRAIGLAMYYVLLPLAALGLWRIRHRREIVLPLLATAVVASAAFTIVSATRYRTPFEPVIVILACSVVAGLAAGRSNRKRPGEAV